MNGIGLQTKTQWIIDLIVMWQLNYLDIMCIWIWEILNCSMAYLILWSLQTSRRFLSLIIVPFFFFFFFSPFFLFVFLLFFILFYFILFYFYVYFYFYFYFLFLLSFYFFDYQYVPAPMDVCSIPPEPSASSMIFANPKSVIRQLPSEIMMLAGLRS